MTNDMIADYVVVGSGAGGGTVAARLAEAGATVILLEAGGDPKSEAGHDRLPEDYDIPAFHAFASENPAMAWNMFVEHYAEPAQQVRDPKRTSQGVLYPRAGTLGGCTAHNAMIFVTAQPCDWDQLAEATNDPGWSAASMARHQQRVERCQHRPLERLLARAGVSRTGHGWDGWLNVETATPDEALADDRLRHLLERAAISASRGIGSVRAGLERLLAGALDPNDRRENGREGLCYAPLATQRHARVGARERLLDVARRFPDRLRIVLDALATRVLFDERGAATGVAFQRGSHLYRASPAAAGVDGDNDQALARREVILAGGAFNTPQLLMLSGIGPRDHLAGHGIDARVDLPGVGSNLQDRYEVCVQSKLAKPWRSLKQARYEADDPPGREWKSARRGVYISNGAAIAFKRKSDPSLAEADLFIFGLLGSFSGYYPGYSRDLRNRPDIMSWAILKARTENRAGKVRLRSPDPRDPPTVQFHYFEEGSDTAGRDLEAVARAVGFVREMTAPLQRAGAILGEAAPGNEVVGADLHAWIRNSAWGHHASCTCAIGRQEEGGVLDARLRVHGVRGLRVVDASIFPRIPGYFIVSAVYMAAERAAEMILDDRM